MKEKTMSVLALLALTLTLVEPSRTEAAASRSINAQAADTTAIKDLCLRVLGSVCCGQMGFYVSPNIVESLGKYDDAFRYVTTAGSFVTFYGTSRVALGRALHHYMRHYLNSSVTWGVNRTGYQTDVCQRAESSFSLPTVPQPVAQKSRGARYYLNPCTFGYTSPFWTWPQWEQELDWMALHGISLPLAPEGIEFLQLVMYNTTFGLSKESMLEYFTGPAYLPWLRMGNIHSFSGPMTLQFLQSRYNLQKKILERMEGLGMSAVLPAFDGHVPNAFYSKYQAVANFTRSGDWNAFGPAYSENYILDPSSALFEKVAAAWMSTSVDLFGAASFYSADTWNENTPPSTDPSFLSSSAASVINGIRATVPSATWIMQGWLFASSRAFWTPARIEAYLSGVPRGALLVLDLEADIHPVAPWTEAFYGHDFVWCALHNFGGRRGIYGDVPLMVTSSAATFHEYSNAVGMGITMEATEQNFFFYETVLEAAWYSFNGSSGNVVNRSNAPPLGLGTWVDEYAAARNGLGDLNNASAWLRELVLSAGGAYTAQPDIGCCIHFTDLDHFPWFDTVSNQWWGTFTNYSADSVLRALGSIVPQLHLAPSPAAPPVHFDVADLSRQFLSNIFTDLHAALPGAILNGVAAAPQTSSIPTTTTVSEKYLQPLLTNLLKLIEVLDSVVGTDPNFLFGRWQADARQLFNGSSTFLDVLDYNAKNIVTMYGPFGFGSDYASKPWAGLLLSYHWRRWSYFSSRVLDLYNKTAKRDLPTTYPPILPEIFFPELELEVDGPFTHNSTEIFSELTNGRNLSELALAALSNFSDPNSPGLSNTTCAITRVQGVVLSNATTLWRAWHEDDGVRTQLCRLAWPSCIAFLPRSGRMLFATGTVQHDVNTGEELILLDCV